MASTSSAAPDDKSKQQRDAEKALQLIAGHSEGAGMNSGAAALQNLTTQVSEEEAAVKERSRALASVVVNKDDVAVVVSYFRISPVEADRSLRLNDGNLERTLRALVH